MTRLSVLGATAVLSMMAATPVFAQAAIQEPGAFAFYHSDTNVLNAMAFAPSGKSKAYAHHKLHAGSTAVTSPRLGIRRRS